jgi:hypothetical protein
MISQPPLAAPRTPSERFRGLVGQDRDHPLPDAIREFADFCDAMHERKYAGWTEVWRGWAERIEAEADAGSGALRVDMRNLLLLAEAAGDEYANGKGRILPNMERLQRAVDLLRPHYPPAARAASPAAEEPKEGAGGAPLSAYEPAVDDFGNQYLSPLAAPESSGLDVPEVVTLCGSTRFMDAFFEEGWRLTLEGNIVLSVGVVKYAADHGAEALGQDVADRLDELHKRKIDLSGSIFVLNVGGYVGPSTAGEIEYAREHGKQIAFLESPTDQQAQLAWGDLTADAYASEGAPDARS